MKLRYVKLDEVPSTNTYVKEHAASLASGTVVYTPCQTAGRGWATNRWESEPGKNLSFTIIFKPRALPAVSQWLVSEAVAIGLISGIKRVTGIDNLKIKWPNDIYAGDRKLAGILIENTITGENLGHCVIGVGLNVNQSVFVSDAPNPVSLCQLLGTELDLDEVLQSVCGEISGLLDTVDDEANKNNLPLLSMVSNTAYMRHLYRNDSEPHPWEDVAAGRRFDGIVREVTSDGHLVLEDIATRECRTFAFKQVKHLIGDITI